MASMRQVRRADFRNPRSKTGCIGCRLRRKKCGEEKPCCSGCRRNSLLCTWPDAENHKHIEILRRTNKTHGTSKETSNEDERAMDRKRRGSLASTHTRHPLLTSSVDGLDVDVTDDVNLRSTAGTLPGIDVIPRYLDPQSLSTNALLQQPISRRLFDHYLHRTHKIMAICQGTKSPFIRELLPMAVADRGTLNALLAFSGIHYADLLGVPVDEMTWMHYGQAVQGQKYGVTRLVQGEEETVVPLLATAMVLSIIESFRVNSGALALQHLKAARFLLHAALQLPSSLLSVETRTFLIERYCYTMILAHITMGPESDTWVLDDVAMLFPIMETDSNRHPGIQSGCVHELFRFIPKVSILAREYQTKEQLGLKFGETLSQQLDLYDAIISWKPTSGDEVHKLCGILYQQALLVYLASSFQQNDRVEQAFDHFIPFLQSIPLDSSLSTTLCWPLAIFGSCARSAEHREIIRQRLAILSSTYAAQSVRDTGQLLEILWSSGESTNPLSFERVMKQEHMTVLLL